jgi:RNA polymerase sigma-70 factor (ECF subfamily)
MGKPNELCDLACSAQAGDGRAFDELARRYRPGVYALCLDRTRDFDTAEDLTQEALLRAHAALGDLREPQAFGPWLRRIALNCCRSWLRRPAPRLVDLTEGAAHLPTEDAYQAAARRLLAREIASAMAQLPENNRLAFLMHLQGSTYGEIAEFTGVVQTTVVGRLHRARSRLRALLRERVQEAIPPQACEPKERAR